MAEQPWEPGCARCGSPDGPVVDGHHGDSRFACHHYEAPA